MTPIADMIAQMADDGVPMQTILLAVRTAELTASGAGKSGGIPVDSAAERRRAYDRERKAAKRNSGGKSGGIPPEHETALSSSPSQNSKNEEGKKERARANRGQAIPPEWFPKSQHYVEGKKHGFDEFQVNEQAEDMRIWARANEHRAVARKSDWDLTFSGWMRRNKGNGNGHDRSKSVLAANERITEKLGGVAAADAYVIGSSGPTPFSLDFDELPPSPKLISSR
jgi:hypothetical protein